MNLHETPMVVFTILSQLAVGTFITLGVIRLVLTPRHGADVVKRVVDPILYAVGPVLVLGLVASMFHMNDVLHVFNVFLHWDSSWLSREIIFGVGFAAFGFAFALLEWFGWGPLVLRQVVAAITALLGIGLVVAESMIYYSLITVPAWHNPMVPFSFFASAILLGVLAVSAALVVTAQVRSRREGGRVADGGGEDQAAGTRSPAASEHAPASGADAEAEGGGGLMLQVRTRVAEINAPTTDAEWRITSMLLKWLAFAGALTAIAILVSYPIYLVSLSQGNAAAQASAAVFSGGLFWIRLLLLGATGILLGFYVYRMAETAKPTDFRALATMVLICLVLALSSEIIGRFLHYAAMIRVGL